MKGPYNKTLALTQDQARRPAPSQHKLKRRLLSSLLTLTFSIAIPHTISDRLQPDTILSSYRKSIILVMASPIETKSSTTPQKGFLTLPREIRDEVYSLLVKGDYIAAGQSPLEQCETNDYLTTAKTGLRLDIFRVSKLINEEAMEVFYSEGMFHFNMYQEDIDDKKNTALFASREDIDRMMNIDMNIEIDDLQLYLEGTALASVFDLDKERRQAWNAAVSCIIRTDSVRNTIWIRCRSCSPDIITQMPRWMYRSLGLLSQFRTVVVVLCPAFLVKIIGEGTEQGTDQSAEHLETLESNMKAIKKCLQSTLGPAVTGHRHHPGHHQYATTLEFHPQEHLSKILSAETKSLEAKAHELELKADNTEIGI